MFMDVMPRGSQLAADLSFGCLSVKFMCLVIGDPDVTNDSAHEELGLFCLLPKCLNAELSQEEEGVDWNAVLPSETPLQSH